MNVMKTRKEMNIMAKGPYLNTVHYLVQALAGVKFPATKSEVVSKIGSTEIPVDWDKKKKVTELLQPVPEKRFERAAEFFGSIASVS